MLNVLISPNRPVVETIMDCASYKNLNIFPVFPFDYRVFWRLSYGYVERIKWQMIFRTFLDSE